MHGLTQGPRASGQRPDAMTRTHRSARPHPSAHDHSARTRNTRNRRLVAGTFVAVTAGSLAALALPDRSPARPHRAVAIQADTVALPTATAVRPPARASRTRPVAQYVRRTVPVGAAFSGKASWYGGSFQGRRTANGERFDTHEFTAASRTLAFGTRLRVCRHSRCVVVRINDRGPYVDGRVLDLSRAASRALGFSGVAYVTATPVGTRRVAVPARVEAAERTVPSPIAVPSAAPRAAPVLAASPGTRRVLPAAMFTVVGCLVLLYLLCRRSLLGWGTR